MKTKKKIWQSKRFLYLTGVLISSFLLFLSIYGFLEYKERTRAAEKITYQVHVTAYTSRPEETDDTPYLTASGSFVRDGIVASNFLQMGTLIKIPEYFGEKVFRVEDRMHKRFNNRVDIWFSNLEEAQKFGKKFTTIEVL